MSQQEAVIRAVCISGKKGEQKHPVEEIVLRPQLGIVGDAHAGNWHRQVSLLAVGTRLKIGSALCEVTQIGKECHADCAIRRQAGDCVMPREGIFAVVLEEGTAHPGDRVEVL